MKKILVILGPTATGKTDLALRLAKKFDGELVACDSRQIYQGLDIGTGKIPGVHSDVRKNKDVWEIGGVEVWLYDVMNPCDQYNAFDYSVDAKRVIEQIEGREKLPIIVGGTGLYLKALLNGFSYLVGKDLTLREELGKLTLGELQTRVAVLSPTRWENLNNSDRNNPRRLIRIIELISMYGYTNKIQSSKFKVQNYKFFKIGLTAPSSFLNSKINQRVLDWINLGIVDEVKGLIAQGVPPQRFKDFGLEYKLVADFIEGKISSQDELIKEMQTKVRQYAKRQMTWFKKEKDVVWFDISKVDSISKMETQVTNWYNSTDDEKN